MDHAHARAPEDVLEAYETSTRGLDAEQAAVRLDRDGPNELPEPPPDPAWLRLARHFNDVLIYVLLAAAGLKAVLGDWVDFGVILAVAVINAVIGFVQEGRAERALEGLSSMLSLEAQVLRDGRWTEVDAADLVVGDVVSLSSGDRVPADVRLLETTELRAEESGLTGESEPVEKQTEAVEEDAELGDRASMAYSGSLVAGGRGVGVVTAIGADTEIGRISAMIEEAEDTTTPLERNIQRFSILLSRGILGVAAFLLVFGRTVHDMDIIVLLTSAVAFAVAAIPEGLPAVVTITLARGVQQMAGRNAITRQLNRVETLGSVTVICSDKTGTLTRNEMTVQQLRTPSHHYDVDGIGYAPDGHVLAGDEPAALEDHGDLAALVRINAAANDSSVEERDGQWQVVGEPTEGALVTLAAKTGFDTAGLTRIAVVPFESEHKLMATLDEVEGQDRVLHVKGAPARVLDRCTQQRTADGDADSADTEPLDRDHWEQAGEELSNEGLRVLAAAERPASDHGDELHLDDLEDLTFVGIVGILDPPRPEAIEAVAEARGAGIQVKMITGDHAGTATAIGREMGIIDPDAPGAAGHADTAITGSELDGYDDEELTAVAQRYDVFARVSPEHKLRLVRALQTGGEVVAMTGDGVNDAPALRQSDVGVAMGIKGTEATKEAAAIVLADDNFATIERAVEEGRRTFDNIQKSIVFLLPTNGAQSLVLLSAVLLGFASPLEPVQILWVNLIAAVTLSLALAFEPAEPDVMERPPRAPDAGMVDRPSMVLIALASLLIGGATIAVYWLAGNQGIAEGQQQTIAVTMLAVGQVAFLINCRNLRGTSLRRDRLWNNRIAWLSIGALLLLQLLYVYVPVMHTLFGSAAITATDWAITVGAALGILALVEVVKLAVVRTGTGTLQQRDDAADAEPARELQGSGG